MCKVHPCFQITMRHQFGLQFVVGGNRRICAELYIESIGVVDIQRMIDDVIDVVIGIVYGSSVCLSWSNGRPRGVRARRGRLAPRDHRTICGRRFIGGDMKWKETSNAGNAAAAVDHEIGARNPARLVRGQIQRTIGNVLDFAPPSQRNGCSNSLRRFGWN